MRKDTLQGATGFYTGRRRRRRTWKKIVGILACIVVFCTTYALILPAITMEGKAYCGLAAHQHRPECYQKTLICGQEETEATAHVHRAECYAQQHQLICGQEENSSVHTHTDACYDVEETLQCGLEEGETASGHAHTEACYESVLICEEQEHTHALGCYSNPEADVESAEVWERTLSDVTLTGNWNQDALAVAQSQLGYQESEKNYEVGQDGETKQGYTRYGAWYGEPYGDWCAMFASFCLAYAGIPETDMPQEASCTRWVQKLTQAGLYQSEEYSPREGDLVFFDLDEDGASDHVGLVAELLRDEDGQVQKFQTIEGNADNRVQQATYQLGEEKISGYAALPENPETMLPEETGNASETAPTETAPETTGNLSETMPTETAPEAMGLAANWETEPQVQLILQLGVKQNVELPKGQDVWLAFVPEVTHEYTFSIKPGNSRSCYLYDASGKLLHNNWIYSSCADLLYELTAGETYYIMIHSSSSSETIPVLLSLGEHAFNSKNDAGELLCDCGATYPVAGTCGENLQWFFADGVLTISGQGSMTSYTESSLAPWYPFRDQITSVIMEPSVTSIGNYAFYRCENLTSITIPDGVISIGQSAFHSCASLTSITIPDGVTRINNSTFESCSRLASITIPESVLSIGASAFESCQNLTNVTIPEGVWRIGSNAFRYCMSLKNIELPDSLEEIDSQAFYNCGSLTSFTIPVGLKSFHNLFDYCSSLTTIYWNTREAVGTSNFGRRETYSHALKVIVGGGAALRNDSLTSLVNNYYFYCDELEFETPNYFTLSALNARLFDFPLTALPESKYYIDEAGVFYRIDQEGKAHLAYCPAELETFQIPKSLPAEEAGGAAVPVVGVDGYAFYQATLSALTFAAPEQITLLEDFAFYHARQLASINGQTTEQQVLALFPNATVGTRLFEDTKISHSTTTTGDPLRDENDNLQLTISTRPGEHYNPAQDAGGAYQYYTGETAQTTITVSNPNSAQVALDTVVRVYYHFDTEKGKLNYMPRSEPYTVLSESKNAYRMTVSETNVPNCYCLELQRPNQGDTISLMLDSQYPSPTSGGGSATIWGGILTGPEAQDLGEALLPIQSNQLLRWETQPDTFPITKSKYTYGSIQIVGDGKGGATIKNLSYKISMSRAGDTLEGMGKDYMADVVFEDVLTLPEGFQISEEVAAAIREGAYSGSMKTADVNGSSTLGYHFTTADGTGILYVRPWNNRYNEGMYLKSGSLAIGEHGELIARWQFCNYNFSSPPDREIEDTTFTLGFYSGILVTPQPEAGKTYTIHNRVTAEQHFLYSQNQYQHAECDASTFAEAGSLEFTKEQPSGGSYMGETTVYKLSAYNPGVTNYERLARIEDPLSSYCYLTPGQIAALFEADPEGQLTLTIHYATLCSLGERQTVTCIDGASTGTTILQNTGSNTAYHGIETEDSDGNSLENRTVVMTWAGEGKIAITLDDAQVALCAPTAAEIQEALDGMGFVITPKTQYVLSWDLTGGTGQPRILVGGERIEKRFQVSYKTTFMNLNHDQRYEKPGWNTSVNNRGFAYDTNDQQIKETELVSEEVHPEYSLTKNWSKDGKAIDEKTELGQGSILDYTLGVRNNGAGKRYSALPLVDHMSGAQALLAPKALNEGADWASTCPTVTVENGREYYLLKEPGTYSQVWTSEEQMADSVTVTQGDAGLDTVIKWYYAGDSIEVTYQAMVCPKDAMPGALTYSIGNETWLSDHQSHRLYNSIPGWEGVTFRFDKKIVKAVGDTGPGATYCPVHDGETIVYRLTLESGLDEEGNPVELTLHGGELDDALPFSVEDSRWSRDATVQLSYGDGYTVVNGDHWEVTDPDGDQQYIRWQPDFSITFRGTAHIYVTLTFPGGIPWQEYARRYSAATLINTFRVLNRQVSVTHDLAIAGKVRLQKGVLSSGINFSKAYDPSEYMRRVYNMNGQADARYYYDIGVGIQEEYLVQYYVSLYNGGTTKVYLTDMQDRLPQGFRAKTEYDGTFSITTARYDFTVYQADGSEATLRRASCTGTTETTEDGAQILRIHFSPYDYSDSVHYDERRDMCYLNPGEAIVVVYQCFAGGSDPRALNTVSMPYYDFTGEGVMLDTGSSTLVPEAERYLPNDGGCDLEDNGQAKSHGFTGGTTDTQWLTSEVSLTRGNIKPGITKALTSKTDSNGMVTQNPISAASMDTLTWTITADNDGKNALVDYTLTDVMQAPYMFTGNVEYRVYAPMDERGSDTRETFSCKLFTISETDDRDTLKIKVAYKNGLNPNYYTKTLKVNGDPLDLTNVYVTYRHAVDLTVAISRDSNENAVMSIRLKGNGPAIPGGGTGRLKVSTRNATATLQNAQFVNTCFITPMLQVWDNTTNKGNMTTLQTPFAEEARPTVRNSAPVTTSYGYVTSSVKRITQTDNPANTAASTDEINYIVLDSAKKTFDYTLSVSNDTPDAMDKLILIDGLPEVGDHTAFLENDPRFSAFKVSLAESPNFTVTVTDNASGAETVLKPESYQVQYTTATEFTNQDWNGTSTWSSDPTGARSIRLVIEDPAGTLIPKKSTVSLRFTCQIDGEAEPGSIAWNSFGYHYSLLDEVAELEAAPLKVGVKVPTIPKLKKQLVDHSGLPMAAEQDETFSFLLYEGAPLEGSYETKEALLQALTTAGTAYREFTLTVPMGQSVSETISLKSEGWEWMNGQEYTIVELPGSEEYGFRRFDLSPTIAYRFTYRAAEEKVITCENTGLRWDVALTKEDPTGATLAGAVFALYSPDKTEQIAQIPAGYEDVQMEIQRDEVTWYLHGVGTTGEDGTLRWDDLLQERYYLAELKTPDGYHLPDGDGWRLLESKRETQGVYDVTVINVSEHEMPETGSMGNGSYTIGGLLLMAGAEILLLYRKKKRGKEAVSSS